MRPEARREAEEWLIRAERDLLVADRSLDGPTVLADAAAFHAQQAAEKALKAFLAANDQPIQKTHELGVLADACLRLDAGFSRYRGSLDALSPFAARFRYPGGPLEPPLAEAQQAAVLAREVVEFVRERFGPRPSS